MISAAEFVIEQGRWWVTASDQAPDSARDLMIGHGRVVLGQLERCSTKVDSDASEDIAGLVAEVRTKLGTAQPLHSIAASFVDDARQRTADLVEEFDKDTDTEVLSGAVRDAFLGVLDALVLTADSDDEAIHRSGASLFNEVTGLLELFSFAGEQAAAFDEVYSSGLDWPRLFVGAVHRVSQKLSTGPIIESVDDDFRAMSWFVQQPSHAVSLAMAADDSQPTISIEELSRRLPSMWFIPYERPCLEVLVLPGPPGALRIRVLESSDEGAPVTTALDGWRIKQSTLPVKQVISSGTVMMPLEPAVDPDDFFLELYVPDADIPVDLFAPPS